MTTSRPPANPVHYLIAPAYVAALYAAGLLVTEAAPIFLWIITSFFIFVLLDQPVMYLRRHGWPVVPTALLLTLVAMVIIGLAVYLFGSLVFATASDLDRSRSVFNDLIGRATEHWNFLNDKINSLAPSHAPSQPGVAKVEIVEPSPLGGALGGTILHGLSSAVSVMTFAVLVPILAFFLLAERDTFACLLRRAFPGGARAAHVWEKILQSTQAFFVGNLVLGVLTFPLFALLLWAFGTPSVITLAGVSAVVNLIPFAGAVLAGLFPAVMLFTATQTLVGPLALYGCCFLVHFVAAEVVTPKVLGARVDLNATTSTIAMVVWGELWGGIGLIIAIPLMSIIKILFENSTYPHLHWLAGLMSAEADEKLEV